ncbi:MULTISPECIES: sensor histidine kinase [unclassified Rathayibacter]|uniref:sensor histidine kinase n=1 Tax=unclassified Rathayibacter TaxID=2609250 RepID=UPI000F4CECB7|nr:MULTISPECIES: hypothetical protein [unclassified Rathayibacter]ROP56748.1 signal transduction histidine kinase [Rathayibacter sp. PhB186]ROS55133.1 signal transduction histidine kinase [Rathayibacter sp. PhB185]
MTLPDDSRPRRADDAEDNRILRGTVAILGGVLAVLAALQAVFALGMLSQTVRGVESGPVVDVVVRVVVNIASIGLAVALVALLRPERRARTGRLLVSAGIAAVVAVVRVGLQLIVGVYLPTALDALVVELVVGAVVVGLIVSFGFLLVDATRRVREKERERARVLLQAVDAVQALQQEELRVRREVAQGLHGRLQNTLVVLAAELRGLAATPPSAATAERLSGIASRLDELREQEVRAVSGALYPVDIEHGLVAAARDLLSRLPPEIAVDLDVHDDYPGLEERGVPIEQRVLLVRLIEEALTNALKHGGARAVRLQLDVARGEREHAVVIGLDDDGGGLAAPPVLSGLERLSRQFAVYGGSIELAPSAALGGARLAGRLPLRLS